MGSTMRGDGGKVPSRVAYIRQGARLLNIRPDNPAIDSRGWYPLRSFVGDIG